jgi:hypothetical protein
MKGKQYGIIGLSKGNGHPFSWSAIFNGYDPKYVNECPYPIIINYLAKRQYPAEFLTNDKVTKIWCPNIEMSRKIAMFAKIPAVCSKITDLHLDVNAVLLARDDAENHYNFLKHFKDLSIPIYVDKPLAFSVPRRGIQYR